jgi:hypothetical protein
VTGQGLLPAAALFVQTSAAAPQRNRAKRCVVTPVVFAFSPAARLVADFWQPARLGTDPRSSYGIVSPDIMVH